MQVSSVFENKFLTVNFSDMTSVENENNCRTCKKTESMSSHSNSYDTYLMNNIQEWKFFCQKQIMANNLDYIV